MVGCAYAASLAGERDKIVKRDPEIGGASFGFASRGTAVASQLTQGQQQPGD